MKKKIFSLLAALTLILSLSVTAFAENWTVRFQENKSMGGNLNSRSINDAIANMEPGDTETFRVWIINGNSQTTRWYMKNFVDKTLEETGYSLTNGGAYSYKLTYQRYNSNHYSTDNNSTVYSEANDIFDRSGLEQELYNSEEVGGDKETKQKGLHEATSNLKDFFLLDTLNTHESGLVKLTVSFEGETQGNVYQNTVADIKMQFATELANNSTSTTTRTAVKTGDENNLIPYYIGMIIAGLLFLYLALDAFTDRLYKKGKG